MAVNKEEVLPIVKQLIGLEPEDDTFDGLITLYLDVIGQRTLNNIHHSSMPDGLKYTWAAMTAGALQIEQSAVLYPSDPDEMEEFETTIGDTTVKPIKAIAKPATGPTLAVQEKVLFDYAAELTAFRKLRW